MLFDIEVGQVNDLVSNSLILSYNMLLGLSLTSVDKVV